MSDDPFSRVEPGEPITARNQSRVHRTLNSIVQQLRAPRDLDGAAFLDGEDGQNNGRGNKRVGFSPSDRPGGSDVWTEIAELRVTTTVTLDVTDLDTEEVVGEVDVERVDGATFRTLRGELVVVLFNDPNA